MKVRIPSFHGSQKVAGFFFSGAVHNEKTMRQRVLAHYTRGCNLYRVLDGYLLVLDQPLRIQVEKAPGVVFVAQGTVYGSAPLLKVQLVELRDRRNPWVLVFRGEIHVFDLARQQRIHPGKWFSLDAYPVMEMRSLGSPPKAAVTQPVEVEPEVLKVVKPHEEKANVIHALFAGKRNKVDALSDGDQNERVKQRGSRVSWLFKRLFAWTSEQEVASYQAQTNNLGAMQSAQSSQQQPAWMKHLNRWLRKAQMLSGFNRMLSRQHSNYMRKMLKHFEDRNWEDALRYAIPMAGNSNPEPGFGRFIKPNASLNFNLQLNGSTAVNMAPDLHEHLKEHYERAYADLALQKRHREAAYVLASLLNSPLRAVHYLEMVKCYEMAAELAEVRNLDHDLIIRLWLKASKTERAEMLARRWQAYPLMVKHFERVQQPENAAKWRLMWARFLAMRGDYMNAVDVAWPLAELRAVAENWILTGLEGGGHDSMRMLAKCLQLFSDQPDKWLHVFQRALTDTEAWDVQQRFALSQALINEPRTKATQWVVARLLRARMVDHSLGRAALTKKELKALRKHADGDGLVAELAVIKDRPFFEKSAGSFAEPLRVVLSEPGSERITDAVLVRDNRLVVAYGEGGLRYFSHRGKVIYASDRPAYTLVPSLFGNMIITLTPRDGWHVVDKVDLDQRRTTPWGSLPMAEYAPTFDGATWYVDYEGCLTGLDVQQPTLKSIWRVKDLEGDICAIRSSLKLTSMLVQEVKTENTEQLAFASVEPIQPTFSIWQYKQPEHRLSQREALEWQCETILGLDLDAEGRHHIVGHFSHEQGYQWLTPNVSPFILKDDSLATFRQSSVHVQANTQFLCMASDDTIRVWTRQNTNPILILENAAEARVRLHGHAVLIVDQKGVVSQLSMDGQYSILHRS